MHNRGSGGGLSQAVLRTLQNWFSEGHSEQKQLYFDGFELHVSLVMKFYGLSVVLTRSWLPRQHICSGVSEERV